MLEIKALKREREKEKKRKENKGMGDDMDLHQVGPTH